MGKSQLYLALGVALAAIIGIASTFFMGDDNPVEKVAEQIVEHEVESKLHLPDGTLEDKIDFDTGHKKT